jgi:hypothetical protein
MNKKLKSDLLDGPLKLMGLSESWTSLKQAVLVGTRFGMCTEDYEMARNLIEDHLVNELLRFEEADGRIVKALCPLADPISKDALTSPNEDGRTVGGEECNDKDQALFQRKEVLPRTGQTGWTTNPDRPQRLCSLTGQFQAKSVTTFDLNPKVKKRRDDEKERRNQAEWALAMSVPKRHETQQSCSAFWTDIKRNPLTKCWTHRMSHWLCLSFQSELTRQKKS